MHPTRPTEGWSLRIGPDTPRLEVLESRCLLSGAAVLPPATIAPALCFQANRGQVEAGFDFLALSGGYALGLSADRATLALGGPTQPTAVHLRLLGADGSAAGSGLEELSARANFFSGSDPAAWQTGIPLYGQVRYDDVYAGVDVLYYGTGEGRIEYDFVVAAGSDPAVIRLGFEGVSDVAIDAAGDLRLETAAGTLRLARPLAHQELAGGRQEVAVEYVLLDGQQVAFALGGYDASVPLVIDPTIVYSTFIGAPTTHVLGMDTADDVAVDSKKCVYVVGETYTGTLTTTPGAYRSSGLIYVMKLNANNQLAYLTYLGPDAHPHGIAVDAAGNAYIAGAAWTENYPATPNAYQTHCWGVLVEPPRIGHDAFVTQLNATGSALVYSTFLGGAGDDWATDIAVDSKGCAYITGVTGANFGWLQFPTTAGAFQTGKPGLSGEDAFVAKFNPTGTDLVYSTIVGGGSGDDGADAIGLDSGGDAYITGYTTSVDFPTFSAPQPTRPDKDFSIAPNTTAFITRLNPKGTALVYSTYLGAAGPARGTAIAVDAKGNAYVVGNTTYGISAGYTGQLFPVTLGAITGAYQEHLVWPPTGGMPFWSPLKQQEGFLAGLTPKGDVQYSTLLGGAEEDRLAAVAIDDAGNIYIAGMTTSPETWTGYGGSAGGEVGPALPAANNACIVVLKMQMEYKTSPQAPSTNGWYGKRKWAATMGGNSTAYVRRDYPNALAVDADGNVVVVGVVVDPTFPVTPGAFQTISAGGEGGDGFLTKFAQTPEEKSKSSLWTSTKNGWIPETDEAGALPISFTASDIMQLDLLPGGGHRHSRLFDGSDVGLDTRSEAIDTFTVLPDGSILISTKGAYAIGSGESRLAGGGEDILRFVPGSLGEDTEGYWALYFDGSDVGLTGRRGNVDALAQLPDGRLILSTGAKAKLGDCVAAPEDLLAFTPASLGPDTEGDWALYFDGSRVRLTRRAPVIRGILFDDALNDSQPTLFAAARPERERRQPRRTGLDLLAVHPLCWGEDSDGWAESVPVLASDRFGLGRVPLAWALPGFGLSAPALDLNGPGDAGFDAVATFVPGGGPVTLVSPDMVVNDLDSPTLAFATVQITNLLDPGAEVLAADTSGSNIFVDFDPASGLLILAGVDTLANYQAVLAGVTYENVAAEPDASRRCIRFVVNDGGQDSRPAAAWVSTPFTDTPPVLDLNGPDQEGADWIISFPSAAPAKPIVDSDLTLTDPDGGQPTLDGVTITILDPLDVGLEILSVDTAGTAIVANYNAPNAVLTLSGVDTLEHYQQVLRTTSYADNAAFPQVGWRTITFVLDDGLRAVEGPTAWVVL